MASDPWPPFDGPEYGTEDLLLKSLPKKTEEDEIASSWQALDSKTTEDLPSQSTEQLQQLVRGILEGTIFTSAQVRQPDLIGSVFLPISLGGLSGLSKRQIDQVGVIYGPMDSALPRSINGYPMLTSAGLLNKSDWARVEAAVLREQANRDNIKV